MIRLSEETETQIVQFFLSGIRKWRDDSHVLEAIKEDGYSVVLLRRREFDTDLAFRNAVNAAYEYIRALETIQIEEWRRKVEFYLYSRPQEFVSGDR